MQYEQVYEVSLRSRSTYYLQQVYEASLRSCSTYYLQVRRLTWLKYVDQIEMYVDLSKTVTDLRS